MTKTDIAASYHGSNQTHAARALAEAATRSTMTTYAMTRIIHTASPDIIDGQMASSFKVRRSSRNLPPRLPQTARENRTAISAQVREQQQ